MVNTLESSVPGSGTLFSVLWPWSALSPRRPGSSLPALPCASLSPVSIPGDRQARRPPGKQAGGPCLLPVATSRLAMGTCHRLAPLCVRVRVSGGGRNGLRRDIPAEKVLDKFEEAPKTLHPTAHSQLARMREEPGEAANPASNRVSADARRASQAARSLGNLLVEIRCLPGRRAEQCFRKTFPRRRPPRPSPLRPEPGHGRCVVSATRPQWVCSGPAQRGPTGHSETAAHSDSGEREGGGGGTSRAAVPPPVPAPLSGQPSLLLRLRSVSRPHGASQEPPLRTLLRTRTSAAGFTQSRVLCLPRSS